MNLALKPMSIICLTRGMSLIGIGVTWLLSLVYLLMITITSFLRYSGYLNIKKDYINHVLLLILVFWHLECLNMISLLSIPHYLI